MKKNVEKFFKELENKMKYKDKNKSKELINLYEEKYEIEGADFLNNIDSIDEITGNLPNIESNNIDKNMNIVGRVFLYLFVWIHVDITIGFVVTAQLITFTAIAYLSGIGFAGNAIVFSAINDAELILTLSRVAIGLLIAPIMYASFNYVAYWTYRLSLSIYKMSLRVFWNKELKYKNNYFENLYSFITKSKKLHITIAITSFAAAIVVLYAGFNLGWSDLFNIDY